MVNKFKNLQLWSFWEIGLSVLVSFFSQNYPTMKTPTLVAVDENELERERKGEGEIESKPDPPSRVNVPCI